MDALELSEDRIMTIWNWCSDAYIRHGFELQFPNHTDPTKTYQWRYIKAITLKFEEWNFDEHTAKQFIDIAVIYVKEAGLLRKGLSVLHQSNMLKICYDKLQKQSNTNHQSLDSLAYIHKWLTLRSNGNILRTLLYRNDRNEMCNIVKWTQASRISPLYLSISRVCLKAMTQLDKYHPEEREFLPKTTELYTLRSEFFENNNNIKQTRQILKSDWRKFCR